MSGAAISLPEIVEAAKEFERASKDSQQLVERLDKVVEGLRGNWSGEARDLFFTHHRDWQTLMQAQTLLLARISAELLGLADRYQQADG